MSTSFNFPANPTLNQIVTLPDGNQAQWNGYTWVSVTNNVTYPLPVPSGGTGATNPLTAKRNLAIPIWTLDDAAPAAPVFGDRWIRPGSMTEVVWLPNANPGGGGVWVNLADAGSVAYPIPVSKGGTGATTPAQARINLGITNASGQSLFADGTAAAPGAAWASEPGLGLYRPSASRLAMVAQGSLAFDFVMSAANDVSIGVQPRTSGSSSIFLGSGPSGGPVNTLMLRSLTTGSVIGENLGGGATAKQLLFAFPAGVNFGTSNVFGNNFSATGQLAADQGLFSQKAGAASEASIYFWDKNTGQPIFRWTSANNTNDIGTAFFTPAGAFESEPFHLNKSNEMCTLSDLTLKRARAQVTYAPSTTWANGTAQYCNLWAAPNIVSAWNMSGAAYVDTYAAWAVTIAGGSGGVNGFEFRHTGITSKWSGPVTWDVVSDVATKENIVPYNAGLSEIIALAPKRYTRKMHADMDPKFKPLPEEGLIAQDVLPHFPESVQPGFNGMLELNMSPILFAYINAFKEVDARLKALEART